MLVCGSDYLFIAHGPTGFDYCRDTSGGQRIDPVPERKEGVAGCDSSDGAMPCLGDGALSSAHAALIPSAHSNGRLFVGHHYGVRLGVSGNYPRKR